MTVKDKVLKFGIIVAMYTTYSRPATRVIAHVTCLPTKLLGESVQQITLALLPRGWISFLLLTLGSLTFQTTYLRYYSK